MADGPAQGGGPALLEVNEMTREFGGLVAVDAVSLTVEAQECVGLIGPNGAGKTTFFNGISGFDRRRGDRVYFGGTDISRYRPSRRAKLGLVRTFQGARVFGALTVDQHLWIAQHVLGADGSRGTGAGLSVALELSDALSLETHGDLVATELPYGLMKALGIVMSVAGGARLLMLDEPVAGLGDDEAEHIETAISHVRERGVAVLVIDHHLEFISKLVDRLVVMDFGKKIADGPPADVLRDPAVRDAYIGS